jgi:hypothetical protein
MVTYRAQSRNGYTAVDLYENIDGRDVCRRTIDTFRSRKQAERVAGALNDAVSQGITFGALRAAQAAVDAIDDIEVNG